MRKVQAMTELISQQTIVSQYLQRMVAVNEARVLSVGEETDINA